MSRNKLVKSTLADFTVQKRVISNDIKIIKLSQCYLQ